jgi:hypothetical protein
LVLGSILKISIPVKAIAFSPYPWHALSQREKQKTIRGDKLDEMKQKLCLSNLLSHK